MAQVSKLIFDASPWEGTDWIVTVRPDWEKEWKDCPVGGVVDKDTAKRIAKWLNQGGYAEVERIFRNGYNRPEQVTVPAPEDTMR